MNQAIRKLQALVDQIIDPPLPAVPGADAGYYDDIVRIRYNGATRCCAAFLEQIEPTAGGRFDCTDCLKPIREKLAATFPDYSALLADPQWPEPRVH